MSDANTCAESFAPERDDCREVVTHCGDDVWLCFQCLKCTTGCPMAEHMDLTPAIIMRLLQLGQLDKVVESDAIWLCAGCLTCSTRCPNGIDIAHIIEVLRHEAMRRGIKSPRKKIASFHDNFLKSLRRHGRSFESGVLSGYAIKNGELLKNARLGMTMFAKGKMPMLPKRVSNRRAIRRIFERLAEKENEKQGAVTEQKPSCNGEDR